ncbi:MAG: hypothetical protein WKF73_10360 [Nocardioidaceae bacterium]
MGHLHQRRQLQHQPGERVALPWTKTVDLGSGILDGGGGSLQAQGDGSADSITCRVVRDGEVVSGEHEHRAVRGGHLLVLLTRLAMPRSL